MSSYPSSPSLSPMTQQPLLIPTLDSPAPATPVSIIPSQNTKDSNNNNNNAAPYDDYVAHPTPWILVICLFAFYFVMSGIENGVAPAIITTLEQRYNLTTTTVVVAQSMTEVTKILSSLFIGHFANKAKALFICLGALVWAVGSGVFGAVAHESMLFISFSIMGLGYAVPSVLSPSILEDYLAGSKEKSRIPYLLGIVYAGASVGVAVGFLVAGLTLEETSSTSSSNNVTNSTVSGVVGGGGGGGGELWRMIFFIGAALMAVPVLLLGKFVIRDTCSSTERIAHEFKKSLEPDLPLIPTVKLLSENRIFVGMCFCLTTQLAYINAFIALLPKYIEEGLNQSKSTASFMLAATVPAAVLGTFLGGYICKRFKLGLRGQLKFCLATNLTVIPMMFVFLADNTAFVIVTLVLAMFVVFLNASPSMTVLALALDDRRHVSYANATVNICMRLLGGIPGPILLGVMIDHSSPSFPFRWAFLTLGLVCTVLTAVGVCVALWKAPDRGFSENNEKQKAQEEFEMNKNLFRNSGIRDKEVKKVNNNHSGDKKGQTVVVIFDPTASHNPMNHSSHHQHSYRTSPSPAPLPRIQVTNPSASPDRSASEMSRLDATAIAKSTPLFSSQVNITNNNNINKKPISGVHFNTKVPDFVNEWADQDLLKAPANSFLSPEAEEAEREYNAAVEEERQRLLEMTAAAEKNNNLADDFDDLDFL